MLSEPQVATLVLLALTASFPCFVYGAWIVIDAEAVTWDVLVRHLTYIFVGLTLTTVPLVGWMLPRFLDQLSGLATFHAIFGVQAYAFLTFGLTGIVRVFRAKYEYDLYTDYDESVLLEEIGDENMQFWRRRIRVGVFGYVLCWLVAYLSGAWRFVEIYV